MEEKSVKKLTGLIISILHNSFIEDNGGSDFEVWCDDNIDNDDEYALMQKIAPMVDDIIGILEDWQELIDVSTKEN